MRGIESAQIVWCGVNTVFNLKKGGLKSSDFQKERVNKITKISKIMQIRRQIMQIRRQIMQIRRQIMQTRRQIMQIRHQIMVRAWNAS